MSVSKLRVIEKMMKIINYSFICALLIALNLCLVQTVQATNSWSVQKCDQEYHLCKELRDYKDKGICSEKRARCKEISLKGPFKHKY